MRRKIEAGIFLVFFAVCHVCAASVNCTVTGSGRYHDPNDLNCQNYTFCVYQDYTNTYLAYNYTCPTTSFFNPDISECTTNYVCNVNLTSNSTDLSSVCTAEGYIPDPDSVNCTSYIQCYETNGTYSGVQNTCQYLSYFNPDTQICESGYNCTSSNHSTETNKPAAFTCTSTGRFEDTTHPTCKAYFMCVSERNGTLSK